MSGFERLLLWLMFIYIVADFFVSVSPQAAAANVVSWVGFVT